MLKSTEREDKRVHPTQKPIAVMRWVIGQCNNPQTILDPFMGSGSTGVAACELGRKFIGIEIDKKYFEVACYRVQEAQKQGSLFEAISSEERQESMI